MNREVRRTSAQFLNGLAVACLAAGAIGPLVAGSANIIVTGGAVVMGLALHWLAVKLVAVQRRP